MRISMVPKMSAFIIEMSIIVHTISAKPPARNILATDAATSVPADVFSRSVIGCQSSFRFIVRCHLESSMPAIFFAVVPLCVLCVNRLRPVLGRFIVEGFLRDVGHAQGELLQAHRWP